MKALTRLDGPAKLTGAARYAADAAAPGTLIAALVPATVPTGRVTSIDTSQVVDATVLTHHDLPRLTPLPSPPLGHSVLPLQDDLVHYEGQPVVMVLADSWQQAREAARQVRVTYDDVRPPLLFGQAEDVVPRSDHLLGEADESTGDLQAGLAAADRIVEATYTTANRHHNPMEPWAVLAEWVDDELVLHASVQAAALTQAVVAELFGLPADAVRVICPFTGGGFGSKGYVWPALPLAAAAARATGQPVKLVLTRAEMFTLSGHQPATRQTITLGATADGRLTAIRHLSSNAAARVDDYAENTTHGTTWLYASPAIHTEMRVQRVDRPQPTPMRAPHEGPGIFPLESAMDELAHELGIDPVELRIRNEPAADPMTGRPFSSRKLVECLREGARRFGWSERDPEPRSMRDGHDLVGWGVAAATMDTFRAPSAARVRVDAAGRVTVETGAQEIGTGLPAMVQAVAAETLGCDAESVQVRHGDPDFPGHGGTMGSMSAMGLGSAVQAAAREVLDKLGANPGDPLADALAAAGLPELTAEGRWAPESSLAAGRSADHSIHTYGAIFVEVRVDEDLGLLRMSRAVGRYAAGRILNPLAAHSQMTGGLVWGYGQAVLEHSVFEPVLGRFLSKNLAGYVVPVNADIRELDVAFVPDDDRLASLVGAKGIGELGAVGVAAAIANAVFHATGRRVRDLPIKIADLL
ncbi:xanthine dehydrogenase family protein molybdopterin-binding subunit [Amycolatopsis thermoflava]|uniref:xanthine dehydrogenase family protein molybdopterin-binding subunit n=1 Tax=Amycolatopsis thermoflava TaxID=84480 RepID=UPI0003F8DD67|nr:xanthine dehydrogenase family protein molybdopterin-binding subunit [Amycolatopsis thermoflava]